MRLLTALLLCAMAVNADAAVIKKDWANEGDRLISYDTRTNLEWLSPDLFFGTSWNELQSRLLYDPRMRGYRYATYEEWDHLIGPNALNIGGYDIFTDPGSSHRLTSFLGFSWENVPMYAVFQYGTPKYEISPSDEAGEGYGYTLCSSSTHIERTGVYFADICNPIWVSTAWQWSSSANFVTHVLVREVREVPEPGVLGLFGLGMAALFMRRKACAN